MVSLVYEVYGNRELSFFIAIPGGHLEEVEINQSPGYLDLL